MHDKNGDKMPPLPKPENDSSRLFRASVWIAGGMVACLATVCVLAGVDKRGVFSSSSSSADQAPAAEAQVPADCVDLDPTQTKELDVRVNGSGLIPSSVLFKNILHATPSVESCGVSKYVEDLLLPMNPELVVYGAEADFQVRDASAVVGGLIKLELAPKVGVRS